MPRLTWMIGRPSLARSRWKNGPGHFSPTECCTPMIRMSAPERARNADSDSAAGRRSLPTVCRGTSFKLVSTIPYCIHSTSSTIMVSTGNGQCYVASQLQLTVKCQWTPTRSRTFRVTGNFNFNLRYSSSCYYSRLSLAVASSLSVRLSEADHCSSQPASAHAVNDSATASETH